ncbi:MAG TPA: sigma-70 family RNA polymerase sigma factor [Solirubrobacteraceae bacterium]|nr:sigma-70 family RNA polymerase sigma factor [Solirubrobacteraceae bacterium]
MDLVAGVRAGDDRAFEALYRRYQNRITAYVRSMVHDHGRAEDITQEVFMSALRRMRETDAAITFKPWIYEIAKNACIDAWRRSRNTNEVSFDAQDGVGAEDLGRLAGPGVTPDSAIDAKLAFDNLCGALGGLSQTHHEILVMREFEGLSYREIGERLGMSRPGVESTLFRARKRLSEEYEELVSGERCLRVQRIVDTSGGRATGLRDQRRMARHIAHCQPCRRYARLAGVDLDVAAAAARPGAAGAAAKIAALIPIPMFLRRRGGGSDEAGGLLSQSHSGAVANWASVASSVDPATASGWSKALATAATVALASVGAGAAIHERRAPSGPTGETSAPKAHSAPAAASAQSRLAPRPAAASTAGTSSAPAAKPAAPASSEDAPATPAGSAPVPARALGPPAAGTGTTQPGSKLVGPVGDRTAGSPLAPVHQPAATSVAPGRVPAAPAPSSDLQGTLGAIGEATTPPSEPAPDAIKVPSVPGTVENSAGIAAGALPAQAPTQARVEPPPTPTAALDTVTATVAETLRTTIAGRLAP